jgi:hypothetical protein
MLEFPPQNEASLSSNVTFDLPYQDRLHTILLRYRETDNENTGFDLFTIVELQGPHDEDNGFKRAEQTTVIHYVTSQGNHSSFVEERFITSYTRDNDKIHGHSNSPEQKHKPSEYIIRVDHSYTSTNLLGFKVTISIEENHQAAETSNLQQTKPPEGNNQTTKIVFLREQPGMLLSTIAGSSIPMKTQPSKNTKLWNTSGKNEATAKSDTLSEDAQNSASGDTQGQVSGDVQGTAPENLQESTPGNMQSPTSEDVQSPVTDDAQYQASEDILDPLEDDDIYA